MYDLAQLAERDFDLVRQSFQSSFSHPCASMEATAQAVLQSLQSALWDPQTDSSACSLARCYITQRYDRLAPPLQRLARDHRDNAMLTAIKYLVLLATAGERPEWNDRTRSRAHQLIPLSSVDIINQSPMVAHMIKQFGFPLDALISADAVELSMTANRTHNVFYVPAAPGSPYIPAQSEFVERYGIKSVIGMGGILPYGHMFAVILFTKVAIPAHLTTLFASLATDIKAAFVPHGDKRIYAAPGADRAA